MTTAAVRALALAVVLLGLPLAAGAAIAADPPSFREAACPFPGGEQAEAYSIDCGYVTVPERRDRPTGRTIELAVAVLHRTGTGAGDPILYLSGGPGGSALVEIAPLWGTSTLRERHDLVIFDQRGTGYSRPALPCLVLDSPPELYTPLADQAAERVAIASRCLDDYRAADIDLAAYTTRENAADVEDLRQALDIRRWSLFGVSYGTRLALEVMRTNGTSVGAALLDSAYPPQARSFEDASARYERAIGAALAACAEDATCAGAYPGVGNRLGTLLADGDRWLDREYPPVPAWYAASVLNSLLYTPDGISTLPAIVDGLERGNAMLIRQGWLGWQPSIPEATASGMQHAVECHDRGFGVDEAAVAADRASHARFGATEGIRRMIPICAAWNIEPPAPGELDPVVSDVPTLILAGGFDPVTPASYAAETVSTLSRGQVVELPGMGHAVTFTPCGRELRDAFLADPSAPLDRSCVDDLPPATFATDVASVPGLPYLLDAMFARSNPTIGQLLIMALITLIFASAVIGWPVAAVVAGVRARGSGEGSPAPAASRTARVTHLARLLALLAIGLDAVFVLALALAVGVMPEGTYIRALGIPRHDAWLLRVADAGAIFALVVALLVAVVVVRRLGRRRTRLHLVLVAFACLLFSGVLAFYGILGA